MIYKLSLAQFKLIYPELWKELPDILRKEFETTPGYLFRVDTVDKLVEVGFEEDRWELLMN